MRPSLGRVSAQRRVGWPSVTGPRLHREPDSGGPRLFQHRPVLRGLVALTIGYAATVALAAVAVAIAAGLRAVDDLHTGTPLDDLPTGIWVLLPFQVAAMSLGAPLTLTSPADSVTVSCIPILGTVVFVWVSSHLAARWRGREGDRSPVTYEPALLPAGLFAVAVSALGVATRTPWEGHSADVDPASLLAGSLIAGTLALSAADLLGPRRSHAPGRPASPWRAAVTVWGRSVRLWVLLTLPLVAMVGFTQDRSDVGLAVVVGSLNLSLASYLGAHQVAWLSPWGVQWSWNESWPVALVLLLGAVTLTWWTARAWLAQTRRTPAQSVGPTGWLPLPAAFAGGTLVLVLLTRASLQGPGGPAEDVFARASLVAPLVMAGWGLAAEALSRVLAARQARTVKGSAGARSGDALAPDGAVLAAIGGFVAVLALVVGYQVLDARRLSPEAATRAYLDALVAGDVDLIRELSGPYDTGDVSDALLTAEVLQAAQDTVVDYRITRVWTGLGDSGWVEVELHLADGELDTVAIDVFRDADASRIFDIWRVEGTGVARAQAPLAPGQRRGHRGRTRR
jgi:hypothetical protein